ncbi:MAG: glycosyltransferase family 4 protein [Bilophila sp.]
MDVLLLDLGLSLRGGQRQVYYLARALARSPEWQGNFTPLVACPKGSALAKLLLDEDLPLLPLPGRSPANPLLLFVLERALRKRMAQGIPIIHTHDANAATVGGFFKMLHGNKVKLVHSRRVSYPLRTGLRLQKYRRADALVGVSAEISQGMQDAGLFAEKIHTIHSGIDPERYLPKEERQTGRFVFLSVGAFTPQKGYSILIQAMSVLKEMEELPPWEVRIVGDGPLFQSILEQAQSLNVDSQLALLGRQDSRLVLPSCDALVVPSTDGEGSSGAIKEGWVTGVPVICSSLPSNTELVKDKLNGLVTHVGNPLALAAAMARCMNEPALCQRLAQKGTATVLKYTDKRMAKAYVDLYQLLARR